MPVRLAHGFISLPSETTVIAASNCAKFIELLMEGSESRPIVLVIGGGTIGLGAK